VDQVTDLFDQYRFRGITFPGIAGKSDDPKINIVKCDLKSSGHFVKMLPEWVYFAYIMLAIEFKGYKKRYGIHVR
jgi:hypothetical protein